MRSLDFGFPHLLVGVMGLLAWWVLTGLAAWRRR